jgi:hypothetical protein
MPEPAVSPTFVTKAPREALALALSVAFGTLASVLAHVTRMARVDPAQVGVHRGARGRLCVSPHVRREPHPRRVSPAKLARRALRADGRHGGGARHGEPGVPRAPPRALGEALGLRCPARLGPWRVAGLRCARGRGGRGVRVLALGHRAPNRAALVGRARRGGAARDPGARRGERGERPLDGLARPRGARPCRRDRRARARLPHGARLEGPRAARVRDPRVRRARARCRAVVPRDPGGARGPCLRSPTSGSATGSWSRRSSARATAPPLEGAPSCSSPRLSRRPSPPRRAREALCTGRHRDVRARRPTARHPRVRSSVTGKRCVHPRRTVETGNGARTWHVERPRDRAIRTRFLEENQDLRKLSRGAGNRRGASRVEAGHAEPRHPHVPVDSDTTAVGTPLRRRPK